MVITDQSLKLERVRPAGGHTTNATKVIANVTSEE